MTLRGSTTDTRDLVERLPLLSQDVSGQVPELKGQRNARLFSLKCGQVVLDLVVLGVFRADIIVDTGSFLESVNILGTRYTSDILNPV